MPLLASVAVILCTAMVLIVWSVMGGFLNMLIGSGRTMTGDVIITWPNAGFAYYDELIADLKKEPLVEAAAPMIETFGLIALPDGRKETVTVRGIIGPEFAKVSKYNDILHWKPIKEPMPKDEFREDPRLGNIDRLSWSEIYDNGLNLRVKDKSGEYKPAMVMGIEASGFNYRTPEGFYQPATRRQAMPDGTFKLIDMFLPRDGKILLSLAPLDESGRVVEMVSRNFPIANEFQSGVYEVDERVVLIPLDVAQEMLHLHAAKRIPKANPAKESASVGPTVLPDPNQPETFPDIPSVANLIDDPARATHVLIRGKGDMESTEQAIALRKRCEAVYAAFAERHAHHVPAKESIRILTWEEQNETMIGAVKTETALLLVLFMIISLVAVFLILAIFWSMVAEKTKDIGVLRAVGASGAGVAGLWVMYGLAIGLVGSALGMVLAFTIVHNINPIHEWLGMKLGIVVWNPKVYYFTIIPNKVQLDTAIIVFVFGVLSSAIGALVPAVRAALMHPVRALRFE